MAMGATAVALVLVPRRSSPMLMATVAATSITLVRPAHAALLPEIARTPDELAVANAASGTVEGLGALIGPLLVGLLVGLAGPAAVYAANRGSRARIGGGGPAARQVGTATGEPGRRTAPRRVWRGSSAAGLRTVADDRRLFAVMAILSGAIALLGAFNVLVDGHRHRSAAG